MSQFRNELQPWFEARKQYRLSHAHVQMARELGMNPKKLGKLANHRQERWKLPLPEFIAKCYFKSFGREAPLEVLSLEELIAKRAAKKQAQALRKAERKAAKAAAPSEPLADEANSKGEAAPAIAAIPCDEREGSAAAARRPDVASDAALEATG